MAVISYNKGNRALVRLTANANLVTVANSTSNSDIGYVGNDPVRGCTIVDIKWSTSTNVKISRDDNLLLTLNGSGHWPDDGRLKLNEFPTGTLNVQFGDTNSSILIEISKIYDGGQNPEINKVPT